MNYKEAWEYGRKVLRESGVEEADLDARFLLEHVCRTGRNALILYGGRVISQEQESKYLECIEIRRTRRPLQYILGTQELMGMEFLVNDQVLIPRQDTETVIEEALTELKEGAEVLDLCTGSGCILLSVMNYGQNISGTGADLSEGAIAVARQNARLHRLPARFLVSDLFCRIEGKYDLILSNPPYIRRAEIPALMEEVRSYEPLEALDGGEDGLAFYRAITKKAPEYLKDGGRLIYEIGMSQAAFVAAMMEEAGFTRIRVTKDLAGHDRVVSGSLRSKDHAGNGIWR